MEAFRHEGPEESVYSTDQASAWLRKIVLPAKYVQYIDAPTTIPKTREALTVLFRCQITTFYYETLSVHYSPTHIVNIQPDFLYEKMMGPSSNGRGGYCMELSIFFHHMLRALGFFVYMTGIRNRTRTDGVPQGVYQGWTHINNIVHLADGSKFSVDVGFGGDGPTSPLAMDGRAEAVRNLGAQEVRLVHDYIPKQRLRAPVPWIYQYRNGADRDWNSFYSFQEVEFYQEDFAVQNLWTSTRPPHRWNVMAVRFLREGEPVKFAHREEDGEGWRRSEAATSNSDLGIEIVGKVMLVNTVVKVNTGGRTSVVHEFDSEQGRYDALRDYFGIILTSEEKQSIQGWDTALP